MLSDQKLLNCLKVDEESEGIDRISVFHIWYIYSRIYPQFEMFSVARFLEVAVIELHWLVFMNNLMLEEFYCCRFQSVSEIALGLSMMSWLYGYMNMKLSTTSPMLCSVLVWHVYDILYQYSLNTEELHGHEESDILIRDTTQPR